MCAATDRWVADAGLPPDAVCEVTPPSRLRLPSTARAPRDARLFLTDHACPAHVHAAAVETASLLVSELVTNAVRHAAPPLRLVVGCARAWLVVEVSDGSPDPPQDSGRSVGSLSEGGRGLPLIEALSSEWGWRAVPRDGKVTWFRLAL